MADILQEIIAHKRIEVEKQKRHTDITELTALCTALPPCRSMKRALSGPGASGIIAEFKRKSPSKGWIHADADAVTVAMGYERAGASAMSVLTDQKFFGGRLADLVAVRDAVDLPLLRKDFIVDPYQVVEARAMGADVILLIAAALTRDECEELAQIAHRYDLETLLEIHSEDELPYVTDNIDMVGVNNRCLGTFHTDVATSYRLAPLLPAGKVLVSESGISQPGTITELRTKGFKGFLIGETFMKTTDPAQALSDFIAATR